MLRTIAPDQLPLIDRRPVDAEAIATAAPIVEDVRRRGEEAVREHATRLGDLRDGEPLVRRPDELRSALAALEPSARNTLKRTAARIERFARAQRECLLDLETDTPAGRAGHRAVPLQRAGCYAPGGRFPLPSSVLMTAVTARSAGVEEVWVASPRPTSTTLAAAAVAGADGLLAVGGAQAVAALAWGAGEVPACDIVVGPGNRWVTAAKKLVAGEVAVDMLAGPSELVVIADASADSATVAADLLAQAEHDPDALPMLIALEAGVVEKVNREIAAALEDLPTAGVARKALSNGFAIVAADREEAGRVCDAIAPEHLQLSVEDPDEWLPFLGHFGAIFLGNRACEVFGDYGAGPNHVLPTGGSARRTGGLSVFHFLRVRTWLRDDAPSINDEFLADAVALARMEGLEAHARAALLRGSRIPDRSSRR